MKVYLVGGAVRDELLGLAVRERDWVVVGATPEQMTQQGYRQVGRDFPVFLHPRSNEEYALARTERKSGPGYRGFEVVFSPEVTLEDDLQRRDLTINAMARSDDGELIDPCGGQADLQKRQLRHVSPAFVEDPVRILRVARFAARFAPLGFGIAAETLVLMQQMVRSGEVDALVPERVWQEMERALAEPAPEAWLAAMRDSTALSRVLPELDALYGVPQPEQWHPEIDTGVHIGLVMAQAAKLSASARVRFAALMHDLGKGTTPRENWPSHHGHEQSGVKLVDQVARRLRIPTDFRDLACLAALWHGQVHRAAELRPATVLKLLEGCDALRRPDRFKELLLACEADSRGRTGLEDRDYAPPALLTSALEAVRAITLSEAELSTLGGAEIGQRLRERRLAALSDTRPH